MKTIGGRASGTLLTAAIAAVTAGLALPASAYNLHSDDQSELNLDVEAIAGTFSSQENYFGKPGNGSDWQEAYIKAGLSGHRLYGEQGAAVFGAFNVLASGTFGDGDAGGNTTGNEREFDIEDAYVGWRSGNMLPGLGENGLEFSFGRQNISLGDGFLVNGDSLNLGDFAGDLSDRGGAYWLAARKAFDKSLWVKVGGEGPWRSDIFWFESDNNGQSNVEMAGINVEHVMPQGTIGAMYLQGLDQNDVLGMGHDRDGMDTLSLRFQGNMGVEQLFLNAEYVMQENGSGADSDAWTAEAGWTFSDLPWSPTVNYRFTRYDEGYDPLFFGFSRGYGTWYQGEVAANYAGPFGSDADIHHIGIKVAPTETLALGALFFDFNNSSTFGANSDGQELDIYAEWVVNDHLIISPLVGIYSPDSDNQTQNSNDNNTYFQLLAIVPF
ncbi:alginate export family protein [Neptunomonas marina]|uniref:Alginate export domain-containing protein n=1 Tax=Neptunomonas marina TaxID=1815562 RepID=A0A437Q7R0_9GAMM|nr:alginate export family protein [Neptunomonas marina]RVU30529.1 hypothetical protein EOE65_09385 [Neptunomonas marina]